MCVRRVVFFRSSSPLSFSRLILVQLSRSFLRSRSIGRELYMGTESSCGSGEGPTAFTWLYPFLYETQTKSSQKTLTNSYAGLKMFKSGFKFSIRSHLGKGERDGIERGDFSLHHLPPREQENSLILRLSALKFSPRRKP